MQNIPEFVSVVFVVTTFATVGFLLFAAKDAGYQTLPTRLLFSILPVWMTLQAVIALQGFYQLTEGVMPPRIALVGVLPANLLILIYFVFFRKQFISQLRLQVLTLLHFIRVPVELVMYWLFLSKAIPEVMTFAGRNFDILSGMLAPIAYFTAFRGGKTNRTILIAYNLVGLVLLANIVAIAVFSLPTPIQQLAFDQPNRAVLYFPYNWLPSVVVPIVLFCHLAALWQLLRTSDA